MASSGRRITIVGIDEAGYGPILGPLVVSASVLQADATVVNENFWHLLKDAVTDRNLTRGGRIPVLDSKKLFDQKQGVGKLEKAILSLFQAHKELPTNGWELLGTVAPDSVADLRRPDWYGQLENPIPIESDLGAIRVSAAGLRRSLENLEIQGPMFLAEVLPEAAYNLRVNQTQNKASVLFSLVLRLIYRAAQLYPNQPMRVYVDRQGGRAHYGQLLLRAFAERRMRVVDESGERSAYELSDGRSPWQIEFRQGGESAHFLIAAASMMSKYLRELTMFSFNQYWRGHIDGLKPTAGYYNDGLRFLKDIDSKVREMRIERSMLVRSR